MKWDQVGQVGHGISTSLLLCFSGAVLFNIQDADNINHIAVFMTGQTPFPDGLGGAGN